ncbi:hypothetical protein P8A21_37570 [Streptomyces poriferorum]|uniref:hypothetical protein n=1 Tax=Streptomyces TaxID=1883 RepID=UPI0027400A3B|nr:MULTISPECIES: hypothetical protein [unclassified Streptomyces]WLQ52854.1 hypothetical protein P8A21_37570 [Streptomyces sp. Alt1]WSI67755.1 hypothetical protein OG471_39500 [Streptomyces sp. NBC_01336]
MSGGGGGAPWNPYGGGPQPGLGWPPVPPGPVRRLTFGRLFNPIAVGRAVFTPSRPDRVNDPVVKRVQVVRTVVGLIAVTWMLLSYGAAPDADAVVDDRFGQIRTTLIALGVTFPVAVAVFIMAARPPHRRLFLRRAAKPAGALLALVTTLAVPRLITGLGYVDENTDWTASAGRVALLFALGAFLLWLAPFALYGIAQALVHVFRTADLHETVPPLLATLLVWEVALFDVFRGAYEGVPLGVRVVFLLGAPLTVTAAAMWELRRLRTRHGITLRAALLR